MEKKEKMNKAKFLETYAFLSEIETELKEDIFCRMIPRGRYYFWISRTPKEHWYRVCICIETDDLSPAMGLKPAYNFEDCFFTWKEAMDYIDEIATCNAQELWLQAKIQPDQRKENYTIPTDNRFGVEKLDKKEEVILVDDGLFSMIIK